MAFNQWFRPLLTKEPYSRPKRGVVYCSIVRLLTIHKNLSRSFLLSLSRSAALHTKTQYINLINFKTRHRQTGSIKEKRWLDIIRYNYINGDWYIYTHKRTKQRWHTPKTTIYAEKHIRYKTQTQKKLIYKWTTEPKSRMPIREKLSKLLVEKQDSIRIKSRLYQSLMKAEHPEVSGGFVYNLVLWALDII